MTGLAWMDRMGRIFRPTRLPPPHQARGDVAALAMTGKGAGNDGHSGDGIAALRSQYPWRLKILPILCIHAVQPLETEGDCEPVVIVDTVPAYW